MDIATIGGLILGLSAVVVGFVLEGGHLGAIFQLPAMLLVIGGTVGASMITTSFATFRSIPKYLAIALRARARDPEHAIDQIVSIAQHARRDGVLGLETDLARIDDPFFKKGVQLVIDGTEVTVLTDIMESEIANIEERHHNGVVLFNKMGGFAPTLGILGTVLGLIHTLANTDDATKMAASIATAFIATLWGVGTANLFFLPIADKLRFRHTEEMLMLNLYLAGTIAIQSGDNPRVIRTKLMGFLRPELRPPE
ncbi:MAG: flagellar motor protein [Candidatus Zixiibacteriota bacterium]